MTALLLAAGTLVLPDLALSSLSSASRSPSCSSVRLLGGASRASLGPRHLRPAPFSRPARAALLHPHAVRDLPAAYLCALVTQGLVEHRLACRLSGLSSSSSQPSRSPSGDGGLGLSRVFGFYSSIVDYLTPSPGPRALDPAQSARARPELRLGARARRPARDHATLRRPAIEPKWRSRCSSCQCSSPYSPRRQSCPLR